jgi:hypothetical protein
MISDNVFSDWPTSLEMFFDKILYSPRVTSRKVNKNLFTSRDVFHQDKPKKTLSTVSLMCVYVASPLKQWKDMIIYPD